MNQAEFDAMRRQQTPLEVSDEREELLRGLAIAAAQAAGITPVLGPPPRREPSKMPAHYGPESKHPNGTLLNEHREPCQPGEPAMYEVVDVIHPVYGTFCCREVPIK